MATPLNLPVGGDEKREPQVAVVPLDLIQVEDVGAGAANVDAWLQAISGGVVTLERIVKRRGFFACSGQCPGAGRCAE